MNEQLDAASVLRASLQREVAEAESEWMKAKRALKAAKAAHRAAQLKLKKFNGIMPPPGTKSKIEGRGRTALVREAIATFGETSFTPEDIRKAVLKNSEGAAEICPEVQSVTRVLVKLHAAGHIHRASKGAGTKSPIYQAKIPARPNLTEVLVKRPSRLLPD